MLTKLSSKVQEGKWVVNKNPFKKESRPKILTKTQKKRLQRARALQKIKQTLQMLIDAKLADKREVLKAAIAVTIERASSVTLSNTYFNTLSLTKLCFQNQPLDLNFISYRS